MQEKEDKLAILTLLTRVSRVNGIVDLKEIDLIKTMATKMGVDEVTTRAILMDEIQVELNPPSGEWERIPYFQMCVMMSGVNGDFDERETLFCKKLGLGLGLRDETLDKVMQLFQSFYPKPVPIDKLREAYQTSHN